MVKLRRKSLKDIKSYDREPSWDEPLSPVVIAKEYPNKNVKIRFCAPFTPVGVHYVCTKPEDMGVPFPERKGKSFPIWCPDFDSENEVFNAETCECCLKLSDKNHLGKGKIYYYSQGFIETTNKKGKKTWGDMQVIVLDAGAISAIKNVYETSGNGIDPEDRKEGYALWIKYENAIKPVKWSVNKAEDIPLKEIDAYSKEDLVDFSDYFKPTDPKEIKESLKRLGYYEFLKNEDSEDSDFDDDDDEPKSKKKKSKDDDADFDDDFDDADEPKSKKKKKYDDDSDDDDEDDEPKKKKKKSKDDDDDDEDDEPKKKKKKSKDEDDDDDDDDSDDDDDDGDSDDDDDDEPKKKKKKSNDDDDDDDEPKKKKKNKYDWDD